MYFRMLHDEASGAMSYLLGDLGAGEAVLVDPRSVDVPLLRAMLEEHGLHARWVLRTHLHDNRLPEAERQRLAALDTFGAPVVARDAPADGVLPFGEELVHVLPTRGHTDHCLSFRWRDRVFCGGLLAVDACPFQPRPALPRALWDSVATQVFTLPPETLLFSGHARRGRAASTVFEERRWHPWFGAAGRDEFLARLAALPPVDETVPLPASPSSHSHGAHAP